MFLFCMTLYVIVVGHGLSGPARYVASASVLCSFNGLFWRVRSGVGSGSTPAILHFWVFYLSKFIT